jgi:hypothetical protein
VEEAMLAFYKEHKPSEATEDDVEALLLDEKTRNVNNLQALILDLERDFPDASPDFSAEVLEPYAPAEEGEL